MIETVLKVTKLLETNESVLRKLRSYGVWKYKHMKITIAVKKVQHRFCQKYNLFLNFNKTKFSKRSKMCNSKTCA